MGIRENTLILYLGDNGSPIEVSSFMGDLEIPGGKGKTIDRFILINNLKLGAWGIDITISRLRKKIENNPKVPSYIITIRGEGYALPKSLLEIQ